MTFSTPASGRGLKEIERPQDVFLGIQDGIAHRNLDAHLGGMVHDHLGPPAPDEFHGLRGLDVIRIELRPGRDVFPFPHAQVVHHRHFVAGGHQLVRHVGADEAGPPVTMIRLGAVIGSPLRSLIFNLTNLSPVMQLFPGYRGRDRVFVRN